MQDTDTGPGTPPTSDPAANDPARDRAPGDRAPGGRGSTGQLSRAPGERYRPAGAGSSAPAGSAPGPVRGALTVLIVTAAGSGVFAVAGSFDLGLGMLVIAAFIGWAVALALVWASPARAFPGLGGARRSPRRAMVAALVGAGSVIVGLLALWVWSRLEGGVLGPIAYADARYGLLAGVQILVAAVIAGIRAR